MLYLSICLSIHIFFSRYSIGANTDGPLLSSSVRNFIESIGARTSTPGGGSASACIASIGSALGSMVRIIILSVSLCYHFFSGWVYDLR